MEKAGLKSESPAFNGRSMSRGVGIGIVLCLFGNKRQFYKKNISASETAAEIQRVNEGVEAADKQLKAIIAESGAGDAQTAIFETHLMFLHDRSLLRKTEATIVEQHVNAEWAVNRVFEEYVAKYKLFSDKHLREKYVDLEDVRDRLIASLAGAGSSQLDFDDEKVVVAAEINPSTLIGIASKKPVALVAERGGWTSHTFILARELGIPAVTGIPELLRRTETGDEILVDGFRGTVIVNPSKETIETARESVYKIPVAVTAGEVENPLVKSLDGVEIRITANLDISRDSSELDKVKVYGVGLYRSEYFFERFAGYPSEEEQFLKYSEVLELAAGNNVKIRTFDLGIGEFAGRQERSEKNPALGLRGIRLSLRYEPKFRSQIRALLRAGVGGNLDITLPMVSGIAELEMAKRIIDEERKLLEESGISVGLPRIGAMIEVPSAVFVIDEILDAVDFVSIGTNDLVQYLLAVDRDNDDLAEHFRTLHPSVLRALKMIFRAGEKAAKEVIVCGEMAGSALYAPILIGLGARTLSMNISSIPRVSYIVENISVNEAEELAAKLLECRTVLETEKLAIRRHGENWPHLKDFLD